MLADAGAAGKFGLIDMDAGRRLARTRAADVRRALDPLADGVIEDDDPIRLQCRAEESLDRGIIDLADLVLVVKILDRRRMPDQRKPFAFEREAVGDRAAVED